MSEETHSNSEFSELRQECRAFLIARGVTSASYRLVPAFRSQLDESAELFHFGFPDAFRDRYLTDMEFRRRDPMADYIMDVGHAMTWRDVLTARELTPGQQAFVDEMETAGMVDGVALPLYGPRGRAAYATYSFKRAITEDDAALRAEIDAHFAAFHTKVILLTEQSWKGMVGLTVRENEVLKWVARGKSNADIGTILGISPETVDTHLRRIFAKLGVNNRMTATLRALEYGMVKL
ncbi:helix-turn-helix transcriptional regulator [Aurantiacibacter gangjinensis]|uniref:helix-turn-helix transcriptional regulator n=1 Tax=Aurantiacibacter gangjinensis TaxID=502682 RepID=UPI00069BA9A7|nr:LuxR family transcriptional regulator [Aurantiacibacter gangjinensis]APE28972.1 Two-component response regulator [Aurantiacibacter gangjinensis]